MKDYKPLKNYELSVIDDTGRTRTFTYLAYDEQESKKLFMKRSRWSARKLALRFVKCREVA